MVISRPQQVALVLFANSLYHRVVPATGNRITMNAKTVVFICTANYYRSRFCEHWFNTQAEARGMNWRAPSRGLRTWLADGLGPIAGFAIERLAEHGIRLNGNIRFPISLSQSDLENADLVVALKEGEHRAMMAEQFPAWADRIEYWHVDDIDCGTADEALPMCEKSVDALVERLAAQECLRRAG